MSKRKPSINPNPKSAKDMGNLGVVNEYLETVQKLSRLAQSLDIRDLAAPYWLEYETYYTLCVPIGKDVCAQIPSICGGLSNLPRYVGDKKK